jgi:hypothetical protein
MHGSFFPDAVIRTRDDIQITDNRFALASILTFRRIVSFPFFSEPTVNKSLFVLFTLSNYEPRSDADYSVITIDSNGRNMYASSLSLSLSGAAPDLSHCDIGRKSDERTASRAQIWTLLGI